VSGDKAFILGGKPEGKLTLGIAINAEMRCNIKMDLK
jgi:hypothetical protein